MILITSNVRNLQRAVTEYYHAAFVKTPGYKRIGYGVYVTV